MRARPEGEARVQAHHRRIGAIRCVGQGLVPGHDPGARTEVQRHVLVHPGAFPVLVLDFAEACLRPVERWIERFQRGEQQQCIRVVREQRAQRQGVPQRRLADTGFEDRLLVRGVGFCVEERDREYTDVLQRAFVARLFGFAAAQGEFEEGHQECAM